MYLNQNQCIYLHEFKLGIPRVCNKEIQTLPNMPHKYHNDGI